MAMSHLRFSPGRLLLWILGIVTSLFLIAPTLVVIPMSFNASPTLEFPPTGFTLQWYEMFFSDRMWSRSLTDSLTLAVLTALMASILGTLAAYALVRGRFVG